MISENTESIRVRFAPSPTGYLHIGGARTALFNYLFARHHKGKFLLRIEDTDLERSDIAMTEAIFRSLEWLGLHWDEEPVFQSARIEKYKAVCEELICLGKAYYCFCTPEELEKKRAMAKAEYKYDRACLSLSAEDVNQRLRSDASRTVRIKVPDGEITFKDHVRGTVTVQNREIDDFILLRSDGQPVYQVAVVVDDHDMGITHVIRGDDHLSNTPKQIFLYRALGWNVPEFAHVPMILGPDKKRLSKRHGATSVEEYQKAGFLPQALVNTLALVGWSPGDDREMMTLEEMVDAFSLEKISKNAGVFEEKKLEWMNGQYIRSTDDKVLMESVKRIFINKGILDSRTVESESDYLLKVIALLKERVRRIEDFFEQGVFFFKDPENYEEHAVKKIWAGEAILNLFSVIPARLENITEWNASALETSIRGIADEEGLSAGKVIHPIRLALTGRETSPGLFETMELLGKENVFRRIRNALNFIQGISFR